MTEMEERVALTVRVAFLNKYGADLGLDESDFIARSAILAMREPTGEMLGTVHSHQKSILWRKMIDAALGSTAHIKGKSR